MSTAAGADRPSGPAPPPRRRRRSRVLAGPLAVLALVASLLAVPAATSPDAAQAQDVELRWAQITAGYAHTCALDTAGAAWCWGDNTFGQLGDDTTTDRDTPTRVYGSLASEDFSFVDISAGQDHTCAIDTAGQVWCWGYWDAFWEVAPRLVSGLPPAVQVSAGGGFTCTVTVATTVDCWGSISATGFLGLGDLAYVSAVSAGDNHACAIAASLVYCTNVPDPSGSAWGHVSGAIAASDITVGGRHTCSTHALVQTYCWGSDTYGQDGDGPDSGGGVDRLVEATVISAGFHHTCAAGGSFLAAEGSAPYCWGANASGQVGDGTTTNRDTPVRVSGLDVVVDISAGGSDEVTAHTCAVDPAGTAWCWGDNTYGQLGDGTTTDRTTPTQVGHPNRNDEVNQAEEDVEEAEEEANEVIEFVLGLIPPVPPVPDPDIVEIVPPDDKESEQCKLNGGDRIVDSTSQGVRTFVYTYQPTSDEVWLCARVEDTSTGDGYGGRLEATPTDADPQVTGVPGTPSTDGDSAACTTTTPNDVPGSHPISSGGVATVDYMVDAYADDDEVWVCLQAGSADHRVVVPLGSGTPGVQFGTVAYWNPDEGTPGS